MMTRDEMAVVMQAGSTAAALVACPEAVPLPAQVRIVHQAIADARAAGLRLPALRLHWRAGRRDLAAGALRWTPSTRTADLFLSVDAMPGHLRRTTYHELAHAHDCAAGRPFDRVDFEVRADAFAARMMRRPWS